MCEGLRWSVVTMVSVAVWTSVPCGVWPLVPGPANTLMINMRYLHYLQCSPVSSLPTLHRAVCAAQCPAAGCCDCSPAPAASPCPRTRWGPGNSGPRAGRLASWYETGAGAPLVDRINYILFLHLRVHHHLPGDLALQEEDLATVDLTLAGWRHGTKRGWVARLSYIVLLISSPTIL